MRTRPVARLALLAALAVLPVPLASADAPVTERLFMRGDGTACPASTYLDRTAGTGEVGCGYQAGAPFGELAANGAPVSAPPTVFATREPEEGQEPVVRVLDALRNVQGTNTIVGTSQTQRNAVGQVRVDVVVSGTTAEGTSVELGRDSDTVLVDPRNSAETKIPFDVAVADSLDRSQLTGVSVSVSIRGVHVLTGYHRLNGLSFVDLPLHPVQA